MDGLIFTEEELPEFTDHDFDRWIRESITKNKRPFEVIVAEGVTDPYWCFRAWSALKAYAKGDMTNEQD